VGACVCNAGELRRAVWVGRAPADGSEAEGVGASAGTSGVITDHQGAEALQSFFFPRTRRDGKRADGATGRRQSGGKKLSRMRWPASHCRDEEWMETVAWPKSCGRVGRVCVCVTQASLKKEPKSCGLRALVCVFVRLFFFFFFRGRRRGTPCKRCPLAPPPFTMSSLLFSGGGALPLSRVAPCPLPPPVLCRYVRFIRERAGRRPHPRPRASINRGSQKKKKKKTYLFTHRPARCVCVHTHAHTHTHTHAHQ
jgi:hypothetical protein